MTAGAAAVPLLSTLAHGQTYPSRPIRLIVGATPGSAPDVIARLVADRLSQRIGQAVVVENRNGASGNLATEIVVRAPADGYTLLLVSASNAINTTLYDKLNFDFIRDIAPIANIVSFPMVVTVNASFPAKSLPEFMEYAGSHPGKVNIGTPPLGSPQHVAGELFNMMARTNIVLVAYRGGPPAITNSLSGQVQGVIGTVLLLIDHIRNGSLRALAVTDTRRSQLLPDVPTIAEFVPGFEAGQWIGLGAPKDTPVGILDRLNTEVNAALEEASMKARIVALGGDAVIGSRDQFAKFIAAETAKWGKVIRFASIKPE